MKKFILKTFVFATLMFLLVVSSSFLVKVYFTQMKFHVSKQFNKIVLGDSHTQCGINDAIWPSCKNISSSAAPYYYNQHLLHKILQDNPHIDTVFLSYHYGSMDKEIDDKWTFNKAHMMKKLPKYFMCGSLTEFKEINHLPEFYYSYLKLPETFFQFSLNSIRNRSWEFDNLQIGGYRNSKTNNIVTDAKKNYESIIPKKTEVSQIEFNSLKKIIDIAEQYSCTLILINTPVYNAVENTDIHFTDSIYQTSFNQLTYWNYGQLELADSCYYDIAHLNDYGASFFTKLLMERCKNDPE